jgi:glycine/D-amino acid oxidase-like deaminating enzyme
MQTVVVGAGVFGAWIAYTLAERGHRVRLLDAHGAGNSRSSSGDETRIIRMSYGADEIYTRMSQRSLERWKALPVDARFPVFHPAGALFTARPGHAHFTESGRTLRRCGIACEDLTSQELAQRFPQIRFEPGTLGLWEPESGVLMARRGVQTVVAEAQKLGVSYEHAAADPAAIRRAYPADRYVFACGAWLAGLFPATIGPRLFPTQQDVYYWAVPAGCADYQPPRQPAWVDFGAEVYALPDLENRGFKIAFDRHGPPFDPETGSRVVSPDSLRQMREQLRRWFPALANAPVTETRVCAYENTASGDFLIDEVEPGLWVAGGGSGHGFKHGPAVGEYVADVWEGRRAPEARFQWASKATAQQRMVY